MKIFVSGGHGFLGKSVIRKLKEKNINFITKSLRDGLDYRDYSQLKKYNDLDSSLIRFIVEWWIVLRFPSFISLKIPSVGAFACLSTIGQKNEDIHVS